MTDLTVQSRSQRSLYYLLTILRVGIGWHLLYEGLVKAFDPSWTSSGFLQSAYGPLEGFYKFLGSSESLIGIVDFLNIAGLILIGMGLFLGLLTRLSQVLAISLLLLYYLSHPPFFTDPGFFREGSYLLVSKDLLEMISLAILMFFPTGQFLGLDGLLSGYFKKPIHRMDHGTKITLDSQVNEGDIQRREILKHLATLPFLGGVFYGALKKTAMESAEEQNLVDGASGPTARFVQQIQAGGDRLSLETLKGQKFEEVKNVKGALPKGMLGTMESSKLILGGNLLSGYVHSRDLIYVSSLVLHYHQKDRIFRTLMLAEQSGVDTLLSNPVVMPLMTEYWNEGYGKIKFISDCAGLDYSNGVKAMPFGQYMDTVKKALDDGAHAGYIQGETADYYIENGEVDKIVKVMDLLRERKLPVGIGAHKIETIKKCVELGLETDFWMKTLHTHDYWSAKHPTWHDNMYCFNPEETISYMESLPQPWIAFKTLAAGAIRPEQAFPFCFKSGADFLCVGMYDFQIVDDVNLVLTSIDAAKDRSRPWRA